MSLFGNLQTYSWHNGINGRPFLIQVFAHNPEEARREVFAIMAEIARVKPLYESLEEEIWRRFKEMAAAHGKKTWAQISTAEETIQELRKEQAVLLEGIPADFFNGCYAASTFDYTTDKVLYNYNDEDRRLGDFIRTTEPECYGPVRTVSFRSCLDG